MARVTVPIESLFVSLSQGERMKNAPWLVLSLVSLLAASSVFAAHPCDKLLSQIANRRFEGCVSPANSRAIGPLVLGAEDVFSIDGKRRVLVSLFLQTGNSPLFLLGDPKSKVSCSSAGLVKFENTGSARVPKSKGEIQVLANGKPKVKMTKGDSSLEIQCP